MRKKKFDIDGLIVEKSKHGLGIFAMRSFAAGEDCFEVIGRLVTDRQMARLSQTDRNNTFRYNKDLYLSPKGELGDFLNHSCRPNCHVEKRKNRLFVVATRPIRPREELVMDYSTIIGNDDVWIMACGCQNTNCRGIIGQFKDLPETVKARYRRLNAVPIYIERKTSKM